MTAVAQDMQPFVISKRSDIEEKLKHLSGGTLKHDLNAIFSQARVKVVCIPIEGKKPTLEKYKQAMDKLLKAESSFKVEPNIILAPNEDEAEPNLNERIRYLTRIARKLKAVVPVDIPDQIVNSDEQINKVMVDNLLVNAYDKRVMPIFPRQAAKKDGEPKQPSSAYFAGMLAKVKPWQSITNKKIEDIGTPTMPIDHRWDDEECLANRLYNLHITTYVRKKNYRAFGTRGLASPEQDKYQHITTVRMDDIITKAITMGLEWAMGKGITGPRIYGEIASYVNNYFGELTTREAISGGNMWPDEEVNSPEKLANGELFFIYEWTPTYTVETIRIKKRITNQFLKGGDDANA